MFESNSICAHLIDELETQWKPKITNKSIEISKRVTENKPKKKERNNNNNNQENDLKKIKTNTNEYVISQQQIYTYTNWYWNKLKRNKKKIMLLSTLLQT